MPQHTPPRPICDHCDGFPTVTVTITTGTRTRTPDGQRKTITANCPACHGTGHTTSPAARAHTRIGA
jgi:DnaJ-class molecular chaperone